MAAPRIVNMSPGHGETDVAVDVVLAIQWDSAILESSLTPARFYVTNIETQEVTQSASVTLAGVITYVTLASALLSNTRYTITVANGIRNILNTPTLSPYNWTFITGDAELLETPVISEPQSQSLVEELSVSWGAIDGATLYRLQLCQDRLFAPTDTHEFTPTTPPYAPMVDLEDGAWFLRVRAENDSGDVSSWSDTVDFSINTLIDVDGEEPQVGDLWTVAFDALRLVSSSPSAGTVNVTPATVSLTLNKTISGSTVTLPVLIEPWDGTASYTESVVFDVSDSALTWDGPFLTNAKYTVDFDDLAIHMEEPFGEAPEMWFVTSLSPLYGSIFAVKREVGSIADTLDDEILYYHLHSASRFVTEAETGELDALTGDDLTSSIVRETVLRAAVALVRELATTLVLRGSERRELGDFSWSATHEFEQVQSLLNRLENKLLGLAAGVVGIKSETTLPSVNTGPQPVVRKMF